MSTPNAFGYTIFCDDVRFELGGKVSYVGAYQGVLYVHQNFPTSLAKLVLAITYSERLNLSPKPVSIRVSLPGEPEDAPGITAELPLNEIRKAPFPTMGTEMGLPAPEILTVGLQVVLAPLQLNVPGLLRVRAMRGDELVRLGSLRVLRADGEERASAP
jgi:hypothetical protein